MNDFTILHLSDLHINGKGKNLSRMMKNLLEDIEQETKVVENIIIVVTGDLVHQAKYRECEKSVELFFEKLKEILNDKICDVYFVPGNHDKKHGVLDDTLLKEYTFEQSDEFYQKYWSYVNVGYLDYLKLVQKLTRILIGQDITIENTYGVRTTEIKDKGKRICFLSFDTSWSSKGGGKDERALKLGKFQVEQMLKQYESDCANVDLTIALGHHPLGWLDGAEETYIQSELLSKNRFGANIYLSGHIHNRDIINWQNNIHSMATFVSGLGWPDGNESHTYPHVYSYYTFNLDLNSIDIYVRSSDEDNQFKPDFRIYTTKAENKNRKIVLPLDAIKTQSYFELGTVEGRSPKVCYITDRMIDEIKDVMHMIWKYRRLLFFKIEHEKYDFIRQAIGKEQKKKYLLMLSRLTGFFFNGSEEKEDFSAYYEKEKELVMKSFGVFLQEMCDLLQKLLANKSSGGRIRVHFRIWDGDDTNIKYIPLVISGESDANRMKIQDWNELLQESYKIKKSLIASVNEKNCINSFQTNEKKNDEKEKWKDFLTAIPDFQGNIVKRTDIVTGKTVLDIPYITFGITIYKEEDRRLLYILDYIKINEIIRDAIEDFLFYFPVDLEEFLKSRGEIKDE